MDETKQPSNQATAGGSAPGQDTPPTSGLGSNQPSQKKNKGLMMGVIIAVAVAIVGAAVWFLVQQQKSSAPAQVKVGIMLPFSAGNVGGFGILKGVELAKIQLNANNIELVQEDSQCDPDVAAEAIKKLIAKGVVAIIGEACSRASLAALPEADASKVVLISPTSSSPSLSIAGDYFFRVVPSDLRQGDFVAKMLYNKGIRKVSQIHSDEPYGNGLKDAFAEAFTELGGTVLSQNSYVLETLDFDSQVAAVKADNPEAVYISGLSAQSYSTAINLLREQGVTAPLYGSDSMRQDFLLENAGEAAEGMILTVFPLGTSTFKQGLINTYGTDKEAHAAAQGYDAFQALFLAIQAGATTGEEVKTELANVQFDGASGPIAFDEFGEISDPDYNYGLLEVKSGEFVEATQ